MPYFKISNTGGNGGGSEPVDYTNLIASIRQKGGVIDDGASLTQIIAAVATIPEADEIIDLEPIAQAVRDKGGTVAEGKVTVLGLIAAMATIPEVVEIEVPVEVEIQVPEDYTALIQSVKNKGVEISDTANLQQIIVAVASIPEAVEPPDLKPIAAAIRAKGGTIAEGDITVADLLAAIATIPEAEPVTVDYTALIQSIRDKGGTVAEGASLAEIILAVEGITTGESATVFDLVIPGTGEDGGILIIDRGIFYGDASLNGKTAAFIAKSATGRFKFLNGVELHEMIPYFVDSVDASSYKSFAILAGDPQKLDAGYSSNYPVTGLPMVYDESFNSFGHLFTVEKGVDNNLSGITFSTHDVTDFNGNVVRPADVNCINIKG